MNPSSFELPVLIGTTKKVGQAEIIRKQVLEIPGVSSFAHLLSKQRMASVWVRFPTPIEQRISFISLIVFVELFLLGEPVIPMICNAEEPLIFRCGDGFFSHKTHHDILRDWAQFPEHSWFSLEQIHLVNVALGEQELAWGKKTLPLPSTLNDDEVSVLSTWFDKYVEKGKQFGKKIVAKKHLGSWDRFERKLTKEHFTLMATLMEIMLLAEVQELGVLSSSVLKDLEKGDKISNLWLLQMETEPAFSLDFASTKSMRIQPPDLTIPVAFLKKPDFSGGNSVGLYLAPHRHFFEKERGIHLAALRDLCRPIFNHAEHLALVEPP